MTSLYRTMTSLPVHRKGVTVVKVRCYRTSRNDLCMGSHEFALRSAAIRGLPLESRRTNSVCRLLLYPMDEPKFFPLGALGEFKWFLEPSWRGVCAYGKLPGIYNGMSSTAARLSLCRRRESARRISAVCERI